MLHGRRARAGPVCDCDPREYACAEVNIGVNIITLCKILYSAVFSHLQHTSTGNAAFPCVCSCVIFAASAGECVFLVTHLSLLASV